MNIGQRKIIKIINHYRANNKRYTLLNREVSSQLNAGKFIEAINKNVPIVEVITSYGFSPKKVGKGYLMHCPFHDDENPSFYIRPDANRFLCFAASCGARGGPVEFVARIEGISKEQAAARLAEQYDLPVPNDIKYITPQWIIDAYEEGYEIAKKNSGVDDIVFPVTDKTLLQRLRLAEPVYFVPVCADEYCYSISDVIYFPIKLAKYAVLHANFVASVKTLSGRPALSFGRAAVKQFIKKKVIKYAWSPAAFLQAAKRGSVALLWSIGNRTLDSVPPYIAKRVAWLSRRYNVSQQVLLTWAMFADYLREQEIDTVSIFFGNERDWEDSKYITDFWMPHLAAFVAILSTYRILPDFNSLTPLDNEEMQKQFMSILYKEV